MQRAIYKNFPSTLNKHFKNYPTPLHLNYLWNFGSLVGLALAIQVLSGTLLATFYAANIELAFLSVTAIMRDNINGWFLKYIHANIASFFFFFLYFHVLRGFLFKSYSVHNFFLWFSGMIIFFISMLTAFLGYVLPWGQMSLWGATVITNLITAIPFIGNIILIWIWCGFSINNATLTRFFVVHFLAPFFLIFLVVIHILLLHRLGSVSPLGYLLSSEKIPFFPYYIYKDIFGYMFFFLIFILFISFLPNLLVGHPDNYILANNLVTPLHIVPEWYFLTYYAILRSIPNKALGVTAFVSSILIFFFLVIVDWTQAQSSKFRQILKFYLNFFIGSFMVLKLIGELPIEYPFFICGQGYSFFYFGSLITLLPSNGFFEEIFCLWFSSSLVNSR